jgi:formamidopyrimidine-DNA glycosylase
MRRGILAIVGSTIRDVVRCPCPRKPIGLSPALPTLKRRLVGQKIIAIDRLGKRVVVRIATGDSLIFEPRMTGLVLVADPPSKEHLRLRLDLEQGPLEAVWYWDRRGLGSVRLLTADELAEQLGNATLGPDALSLTAEQMRERYVKSRREIKVALLDQRAVAGIGNLYAAEILHAAKVHPQARCHRLTVEQWVRIHAAMRQILELAIRYEGSTLSDGTYRNALNKSGGYQNEHRVYDRAGKACLQCSGKVRRIVQAQRATFYCPGCQRKGK